MKNLKTQKAFFIIALIFSAVTAVYGIAAYFLAVPRIVMIALIVPAVLLTVIAAVSSVKNRGAYNKNILKYIDISLVFMLAAVILWAGANYFLFSKMIAAGTAVALPDGYHIVSGGEIVADITKEQYITVTLAEIKLIMSECAAFCFISAFLFKINANYLKSKEN